ncbi:beta and gamma crystallin [Haliangium ochraceum DSM 14365]|uniref:Beta and gamma crystallin n=2 Tax=Haliangium ochraceum TaxID=80816 RepID=D0LSA0_HALO1|nr:beta and gamma crystallin [Haliangium ochraceum DSM 14365]
MIASRYRTIFNRYLSNLFTKAAIMNRYRTRLPQRSALLFALALTSASCVLEAPELDAELALGEMQYSIVSTHDLAKRWAPIHYMDVDATGTYAEGGRSDYITAIDYDGDWDAQNNWNNLPQHASSLAAYGYYSVVETATHWFLSYAFFHPRDWTDIFFLYELDQHENDLEGVLIIVEKDGSSYGRLLGAVTVSHSDFFSYASAGSSLSSGLENIDGTLHTQSHAGAQHPVTAQEAKGHGLKAWPQYDINGDGIVYYPSMSDNAEVPSGNSDSYVEYELIDIFEVGGLWDQRFNTSLFYNAGGGFKGNDFGDGGANAPWAWNDGDDGVIQGGEIATDPAKLVDNYFDGVGDFSHVYTSNPYGNAGGPVTVYQHCNLAGYAVTLAPGAYTLADLQARGIANDDLSSLRIENGRRVTLYQHDNFGGSSVVLQGSDGCLGDEGFNDEVSSLRIE